MTAPVGGRDRFPLSVPRNRAKRLVKIVGGELLLRLRPRHAQRLGEGRAVPVSAADRWMLGALGARAARAGSAEALHGVHRAFWASEEGAQHLLRADWRFNELFLRHHTPIVEAMAKAIAQLGLCRLVEIGSGTGEVADYLSKRFPQLEEVIGVELNQRLVDAARHRFPHARFRLECADARERVPGLLGPHTLLFTTGGVLEYFTAAQVSELFWSVRRRGGGALALVEPVDATYDFDAVIDSRAYGTEMSYTHNYVHLAEQAGLHVHFRKELFTGPTRWILLLASSEPVSIAGGVEREAHHVKAGVDVDDLAGDAGG